MPDDAHRYCGGYYDAHTCEEIDSLTERAEKAEAQVQAVRALCQSARVSISKGCLCYGDECSGTCGRGKPMGWNLNPDDILRALDGDA